MKVTIYLNSKIFHKLNERVKNLNLAIQKEYGFKSPQITVGKYVANMIEEVLNDEMISKEKEKGGGKLPPIRR